MINYLKLEKQTDSDIETQTSDTSSWYVSYSDIVTLLLVFFIIFYVLEKSTDKSKVEGMIAGVVKTAQEKALSKKFPTVLGKELVSILKNINSEENQNILLHENSVTMIIKNVKFFNQSSTVLTKKARFALKKALSKLLGYKDQMRFNIRGYSDSVPISKNKKISVWWNSNIELSVARSLRARDYIISLGFLKENIYVSGEGDQVSYLLNNESSNGHIDVDQNDVFVSQKDLERRITIRVEPI